MKFHISRQTLYALLLAFVLLIVVLVFSFGFLIPEGKEYRTLRLEKKKHTQEMMQYQQWHDETFAKLKTLQSENKQVITAFENSFDPKRFIKNNSGFFELLKLSKVELVETEGSFSVYEVNTTSKIDSPQSFYGFLESVNKSDWIVAVNFPIHFVRDNNLIRSSFTMKVHELAAE